MWSYIERCSFPAYAFQSLLAAIEPLRCCPFQALAALASGLATSEAHWFENAYIACRDRIFIQGICKAMSRIGKDTAGGPLAPESVTRG